MLLAYLPLYIGTASTSMTSAPLRSKQSAKLLELKVRTGAKLVVPVHFA